MNDDTLLPFELPSVGRKKLTIDFAGGSQSSDGGLLLCERRSSVAKTPMTSATGPNWTYKGTQVPIDL